MLSRDTLRDIDWGLTVFFVTLVYMVGTYILYKNRQLKEALLHVIAPGCFATLLSGAFFQHEVENCWAGEHGVDSLVQASGTAVGILGTFLAFALVIRVQQTLSRWWDARSYCGRVAGGTSRLASFSLSMMYAARKRQCTSAASEAWTFAETDKFVAEQRQHCARLLQICLCMMPSLRPDLLDASEGNKAVYGKGTASVMHTLLTKAALVWLDSMEAGPAERAHVFHVVAEIHIEYGGAMKIKNTPLPILWDVVLGGLSFLYSTVYVPQFIAWAIFATMDQCSSDQIALVRATYHTFVFLISTVLYCILDVIIMLKVPYGYDLNDIDLDGMVASLQRSILRESKTEKLDSLVFDSDIWPIGYLADHSNTAQAIQALREHFN